jgi:hypothetical protein
MGAAGRGKQLVTWSDIGADEETSGRSRECACRVLDNAHDHEGLDLYLAQRRGGVWNSRHDEFNQVCRFDLDGTVSGRLVGTGVEAVV